MTRRRGQQRQPLNGKPQWALWSTEAGLLPQPQPIDRLPTAAVISADGKWAELEGNHGVEKVFCRLGGKS